MKRAFAGLSVAVLFLLAFTGVAAANGAVAPEEGGLAALLGAVWAANGWWLKASFGLVLAVTALKKYAPGKVGEFVNGDVGGTLMVLLGAFGGALATSLSGMTEVPMSTDLAWDALKVAVGAAGGYSIVKKLLVVPLMESAWYQTKAPAWLKTAMALVLWAFTKKSPALAKAEDAGNAAVVANPPPGVDGVVGPAKDI